MSETLKIPVAVSVLHGVVDVLDVLEILEGRPVEKEAWEACPRQVEDQDVELPGHYWQHCERGSHCHLRDSGCGSHCSCRSCRSYMSCTHWATRCDGLSQDLQVHHGEHHLGLLGDHRLALGHHPRQGLEASWVWMAPVVVPGQIAVRTQGTEELQDMESLEAALADSLLCPNQGAAQPGDHQTALDHQAPCEVTHLDHRMKEVGQGDKSLHLEVQTYQVDRNIRQAVRQAVLQAVLQSQGDQAQVPGEVACQVGIHPVPLSL